MTLTITFELGTDLDKAQVLVQNRVAIAEPRLPEDVRRLGVTTLKSSPDLLMVVHLISPDNTYDQLYIGNYALIQVRDALARVDGVGDVIAVRPARIQHAGVARSRAAGAPVAHARRRACARCANRTCRWPPASSASRRPRPASEFQLTVNTLGRLLETEQFERNHRQNGRGRPRSCACATSPASNWAPATTRVNSYLDNEPAVALAIAQRPGSNALATSEGVQKRDGRAFERTFPQGLEYRIVYNPTVFVDESINSVIHTLFEAVVLVVIVVLVFLQNWRASLIPLLAIPVSLIGTFAAMAAFGFSLNMLSLFGLVLAIGIVVDDAIVVVENVERHIAAGLVAAAGAHKAMDEVTGAVIAIAFGLSAVFVPTAFISGISGQFLPAVRADDRRVDDDLGVRLADAQPALCALLLQPHGARRIGSAGCGTVCSAGSSGCSTSVRLARRAIATRDRRLDWCAWRFCRSRSTAC